MNNKIPRVEDDFVTIYIPGGDKFPGPDSKTLKAGQWYNSWVPNDHTFIQAKDGFWHGFGCTDPANEAYWLSFHITSSAKTLRESLMCGRWKEHKKILTPADRPEERKELYAPFVKEYNGEYYMFYGPTDIRLAKSSDLFNWRPCGTLFTHSSGCARDPHVSIIDGLFYMVYMADQSVFLRTSKDFLSWSEPSLEIYKIKGKGWPESPSLIKYNSAFYLFWTICDGTCSYDDRTHVFRSYKPDNFNDAEELPLLRAHCPEFIQDDDGQWYISSAERPNRSISMAKLKW